MVPRAVTADQDEACSGVEVDDRVFSAPMPPEVYQHLEAFVVAHHVPRGKAQAQAHGLVGARRIMSEPGPGDTDDAGESFVERWSRLKKQARENATPDDPAPLPAAGADASDAPVAAPAHPASHRTAGPRTARPGLRLQRLPDARRRRRAAAACAAATVQQPEVQRLRRPRYLPGRLPQFRSPRRRRDRGHAASRRTARPGGRQGARGTRRPGTAGTPLRRLPSHRLRLCPAADAQDPASRYSSSRYGRTP